MLGFAQRLNFFFSFQFSAFSFFSTSQLPRRFCQPLLIREAILYWGLTHG